MTEIERLYRTRFASFLRVATAITGDRETAREAVQEGFADALRSRRTFRGEGSLDAWVWRSVVNCARDARTREPGSAEPAGELIAHENGGERLPSAALRAAIALLGERQRLVVFLRYYADLDYRSIAAALGITVGTVSATLNAAHTALRRALQEVPR